MNQLWQTFGFLDRRPAAVGGGGRVMFAYGWRCCRWADTTA
ncbi:MAG: hypothetical protein U1G05_05050 [Kiritimatiellia bacterium]